MKFTAICFLVAGIMILSGCGKADVSKTDTVQTENTYSDTSAQTKALFI